MKFTKQTNLFLIFIILIISSTSAIGASSTLITGTMIDVSLVNQDPDPAVAGEIVELRVGIENKGSDSVSNLILELVPAYPFELVSGESAVKDLGTLNGYQTDDDMKIIKFKVKVNDNASAGSYELDFKNYKEGSSVKTQKTIYVDVKNQDSAEVIHIDKSTLIPGKETPLKFTINNMGTASLNDITFKWENSDKAILPVGSDNRKYIKSIPAGGSAELEYKVIADTSIDPGLYKLTLTLSYTPVNGAEQVISTIAGVYVGGKTDFDIAFSDQSAGEVSFTIANIGSNPANSVSVNVPEQRGWEVSGSSSSIIGNLNQGDYTIASYTMSGRTETINLEVAYTDTMGIRQLVKKTVKVGSSMNNTRIMHSMKSRTRGQQTTNSTNYTWYLIGGIVLVVGYYYFRKYKKNKLKNPKAKLTDLLKNK